jgi:Flp pilus assembly protein TadD
MSDPAAAAPPAAGPTLSPPDGATATGSPSSQPDPTATPTPAGPPHGTPDQATRESSLAQRSAESGSLTEQGIHLCRSARWRDAIDPLRRATEADPANATAFYYLGDACNHADALAQALEAFESAVRLQPDHWRALKGIGIVLDRMRRPQEAAAAYQRAREAQHRASPRTP